MLKRHIVRGIVFNLGTASVGEKVAQALIPCFLFTPEVIAHADTAPVGADLKINIKINSSSIWNDTDRLIIADGEISGSNVELDVRMFNKGDRLTLDIDQVGSATPGGDDLLITILC